MAEAEDGGDFAHPGVHHFYAGHLDIDGVDADAALGGALRVEAVVGGGDRHQYLVVEAAEEAAALAFQYANNDKLAAVDADGLADGVKVAKQGSLYSRAEDGDLGFVFQLAGGDETAFFHREVAYCGVFGGYADNLGKGVVAAGGDLPAGVEFGGDGGHGGGKDGVLQGVSVC